MSRRCCCNKQMPISNCCGQVRGCATQAPAQFLGSCASSGGCNFSCFVILILILLQFSRRNHCIKEDECCDECGGIDKGIIFIIALFYLSCCNPCGRNIAC